MSSTNHLLSGFGLSLLLLLNGVAAIDYGAALTKSLLYFEAQRSGKLPASQRAKWRGDSGLKDGSDVGVDLVGGYYDAGDNVKFGFPMAFTITMLAWSVVDFESHLAAKNELSNALEAVKWGTDYLIKAHPQPDVLYGEVGDGDSDHECWMRPEDMTTPRTTFRIDDEHPGSDLAAESSAALAAASIAFQKSNPQYSSELLRHSKELFDFAQNNRGRYQNSIPAAGKFYSSSGDQDELLWAAAWLYRATGDQTYLAVLDTSETGYTRHKFSWDDKYIGAQILVAKMVLEGKLDESYESWGKYWSQAEDFICNCIQEGDNDMVLTEGGLLWFEPWNNLQYTTAVTFLVAAYGEYLGAVGSDLACSSGGVSSGDLIAFARSQADYILGSNPNKMSYMVGVGPNYPKEVHHRGASIVSIKQDPKPVTCKGGFEAWYNRKANDPNVLDGAIVGGPDSSDSYTDARSNFNQAEPATANTAPFVGVLARLASG